MPIYCTGGFFEVYLHLEITFFSYISTCTNPSSFVRNSATCKFVYRIQYFGSTDVTYFYYMTKVSIHVTGRKFLSLASVKFTRLQVMYVGLATEGAHSTVMTCTV